MISSSELSAMTASFLQSGGQIEKHDIIVRDYAAPKGGFMMTSARDAVTAMRNATEQSK